eukprot:4422614-Prorocentrum_lima.AAC.1
MPQAGFVLRILPMVRRIPMNPIQRNLHINMGCKGGRFVPPPQQWELQQGHCHNFVRGEMDVAPS